MSAEAFRVQLDGETRRKAWRAVVVVNVLFSATTAAFIVLWSRMDALAPTTQHFVRYFLIQGHLATENVIAAWYSSMLLLSVAAVSGLAWAADRRTGAPGLRHGWIVFAVIFTLLSIDEIGSLHERVGMIPVWTDRPLGWAHLLAAPILLVGGFMFMFAWLHLRRVRVTAAVASAGVALFLLNPFLERIEMAMIHGAGRDPGTWERQFHDALLVLEEGGLELFGILCFLVAVTVYVARQAGELSEWCIEARTAVRTSRLVISLLAAGVFASGYAAAMLPDGDTGILENWFPAAAWMLVAGVAVTRSDTNRRRAAAVAAAAMILSMTLGAGLYVYLEWMASRARWVTPVAAVITAGLALEALLHPYLFRRSPMSSIASPTLRRPRPNPS